MSDLRSLRKMRQDRELSLRALAKLANISVAYLSNLEHGKSSPTVEVADRLCAALGVSRDVLLGAKASSVTTKGKSSTEALTHFQCGACQGWWSLGDAPLGRHKWYCTWCGEFNDMTPSSGHRDREGRG